MRTLVRLFAVLVVVPSVYFFMYWVPFSLLPTPSVPWLPSVVSLLCAILAARYAWEAIGNASGGLVASVATGALLVGGIGFVGGFFGPMVFAPDANQGPMLGLFITGPLGFVAGAIGGAITHSVKRRRAET